PSPFQAFLLPRKRERNQTSLVKWPPQEVHSNRHSIKCRLEWLGVASGNIDRWQHAAGREKSIPLGISFAVWRHQTRLNWIDQSVKRISIHQSHQQLLKLMHLEQRSLVLLKEFRTGMRLLSPKSGHDFRVISAMVQKVDGVT